MEIISLLNTIKKYELYFICYVLKWKDLRKINILLKKVLRAANVIVVTDCKVISLDRPTFKRLLGLLKDILKRNSEAYKKYTKV